MANLYTGACQLGLRPVLRQVQLMVLQLQHHQLFLHTFQA